MKHLPYGGSTMHRTLACPAWVRESEGIPAAPANEFALAGTVRHHYMEQMVGALASNKEELTAITAGAWLWKQAKTGAGVYTDPETGDTVPLDDDIVNDLLDATEALPVVLDELGGFRHVELLVEPFVELIPDLAGGSIDLLAVSQDGTRAAVIDYKFGHRTVRAENNPQLKFYALCASVDPATATMLRHVETFTLAIIQPNDDGDTLDSWDMPESALDELENEVYDAIDAAQEARQDPNTAPKPGAHCRYCPAQPTCKEKQGLALASRRMDPAKLDTLEAAMSIVPELEDWIKAVKQTMHEQLESGWRSEQFKLVNKRASRVWTNQAELEEKLKKMRRVKYYDDACNVALKSPAQLEKVFKAKKIDAKILGDYITSVSSGTTVAPIDDKRPDAGLAKSLGQLGGLLAVDG